jgi:hypothetical protein
MSKLCVLGDPILVPGGILSVARAGVEFEEGQRVEEMEEGSRGWRMARE